jgi:hypothetical protein
MRGLYLHRKKALSFTLLLILALCTLTGGCAPTEEPSSGSLLIEGDGVESKVSFTLEELKSMKDGLVEADYFSINSYGSKGYSHFKGVWVWYVLNEKVSLKGDASQVSFIAEDGYQVDYTIKEVKREDYIDEQNPETKYKMILAWEENGVENDLAIGSPFQLVVGQREPGDVNRPFWVRNIKTIRVD